MTSHLWRKISNMAVWGELRISGIPSSSKSTISIFIVIDVTSFINNAIWLDEMDRFVYKIPRRKQKLFGYTIKNEYIFWYFIFSIMSLQVCFYQAFHRTFAFMCIYIHKKESLTNMQILIMPYKGIQNTLTIRNLQNTLTNR